jgi:hypothetical protein
MAFLIYIPGKSYAIYYTQSRKQARGELRLLHLP